MSVMHVLQLPLCPRCCAGCLTSHAQSIWTVVGFVHLSDLMLELSAVYEEILIHLTFGISLTFITMVTFTMEKC